MKGRALIVPRRRGETVRRTLRERNLLRTDLAIFEEADHLVLPLVDDGEVPPDLGEVAVRDFAETAPARVLDYRDLLVGEARERARLPHSFDVIGDVVLVRVPPQLTPRAHEIGEALLEFVPGARIVGNDRGVKGTARRRSLAVLAGSGGWRTRHRENGIDFEVDLERAYFSPRLAHEHSRVASEIAEGDRVYDLCCGVGPFAVTIARDGRAASITAVDSNADAVALLRDTLNHRPFAGRVTPIVGDVREFAATAPPVERVILNLPHEGIKYLPSVARTVAPSGRLYYYEVTSRAESEVREGSIVGSLGRPAEWTVVDRHVVHPYSPASDLVAYVLARRAEE